MMEILLTKGQATRLGLQFDADLIEAIADPTARGPAVPRYRLSDIERQRGRPFTSWERTSIEARLEHRREANHSQQGARA
jgi:hypothetical protein